MAIQKVSRLMTIGRTLLVASLVFPLVFLLVLPASAQDPAPALVIGGATTEGLVISTNATAFTRTFQIINTGEAEIEVAVDLPGLIGPDSKPVTITWTLDGKPPGTTVKVGPQASALLEIKATLPGAGLYESVISLIYNKKRNPIPLKITRAAAPPTITVVGLDPVAFSGRDQPLIRFSLKETGGVPLTLHSPALLSLTRKMGERSLQAEYGSVEFYKVKNDGNLERIGESVVAAANQSLPIVMTMKGVDSPGEYAGSLALSSNDGALPAQSFTFYVKRSWFWCALLITIGVVISHWLHNYVKTGRPRLLLARRIAILRQDIGALSDQLTDNQDKDLLDVMRRRLDKADDEADIGDATTVEPVLNDLNAKLSLVPLWSSLRQRIEAVQPPADADAARLELQAAREFLEANKNDSEADINAMKQRIRAAFTTIDEAIRKRLVEDVAKAVETAKAARADLSPDRLAEFDLQVSAPLTAATTAIQKSPPDAAEARRLINSSRLACAQILARDLDEKISLVVRPASMKEEDFRALRNVFDGQLKKVLEATDGATAVREYEDLYAAYLKLLLRVARETLNELQPDVDKENNAEHKTKLAEARKSLDIADIRLRNGEADQCRESYDAAKSVLDEAVKWFEGPTPMGGSGSRSTAPEAVSLSTVPAMRTIRSLALPLTKFSDPLERRFNEWLELSTVKKKLQTRDLIVSLIVGAAAIILGLYNIWLDNPAWGTGKDLFVALLWGLGLHQLAGNLLFAKLDLTQLEKDLTGKEG